MTATSTARRLSTVLLTAALTLGLTGGAATVLAPQASAAGATAGTVVEPFTECVGGFGSGSSWDDAGRTYLACGSTVRVYTAAGAHERTVSLPFAISDVAAAPDASVLYVARGTTAPKRLDRQADGTYAVNATWAPAAYTMWGATFSPRGHWLATDGSGNLYLADGAWADNGTHTVLKYAPDGRLVTRFGEWRNTWDTGAFYWQLNGLSVTRDGTQVVTVEGGNDRLQRWGRQADGSYAVTGVIGSTQANHGDRQGDRCNYAGWTGEFASSYDMGFDGAGNIYVLNTTCTEVVKLSPTGAFLASWDLRNASSKLPHGFAVAKNGDVYVPQAQRRIRATTPTTPPTDAAPVITSAPAQRVVGPVGTTTVPLRFTWAGRDDVAVVRYEARLRTDDGLFTDVALASPTATAWTGSLAPGKRYDLGVRAVDGGGRTSDWSYSPRLVLDAVQEKAASLTWSAGWSQAYGPELFGEGLKMATTPGANVTTTFAGREVAWIGPRNAGRGVSKVYLDGALVATVDQYSTSSASQHRQLLWSTAVPAGSHTLKIVGQGTPDRSRVDVDALVVLR